MTLFDPDPAAVCGRARAEGRTDRQAQPGLRPICLTAFVEAACKHEHLETAIGDDLDCSSRCPLLQANVLASIPKELQRLYAGAPLDGEQRLLVGIDQHLRAVREVELPELHE